MEYQGRRGRRGRGRSYNRLPIMNHVYTPPHNAKPWSILSSFYSFIIMTSLITLVYLMLDYHCAACNTKYDLNYLTTNLENIARNLTIIQDNYYDLEMKITKVSQELPKIEGQIDILEAFTNAINSKDFGWNPETNLTLPNVDVFLNKPLIDQTKNVTKKCPKRLKKQRLIHQE